MIKEIALLLVLSAATHAVAKDAFRVNDDYLSGQWQCASRSVSPSGMVIDVKGSVIHESSTHRYEYTGQVLSYKASDPSTYSQLALHLAGAYELNGNQMRNESELVRISLGPDGLGTHSAEFLSGFTESLKKPVTATLTPISNDEFRSVVVENGEVSLCHRKKSI